MYKFLIPFLLLAGVVLAQQKPVSYQSLSVNSGNTVDYRTSYYKPFIANRNFSESDSHAQNSNGTDLSRTYKIRKTVTNTSTDIQLAYTNLANNPIAVTASIQTSDGTYYPLYFNGRRSTQIDQYGWVQSDPLSINLTKGDYITILNTVSVSATGQYWNKPQAVYDSNSGEASTANADYTMGGGSFDSYRMIYAPVAVYGRTMTKVPVIAGIGDSIMYGSGNTDEEGIMAAFGSYASNYSTIQMGQPGAEISSFISSMHRKKFLLTTCTAAITEAGVNNVNNGASVADLQANTIALWRALTFQSIRVFQTTLTPRTNSIDGWVTVANQTVTNQAKTNVMAGYNDWLRNGAPMTASFVAVATGTNTAGTLRIGSAGHPLSGYFDVADKVETSRNSGIWKAGYTTDGLHMSTIGNAAGITAINVPLVTSLN